VWLSQHHKTSENTLNIGFRKLNTREEISNLHREVKCHKLHDRPKTIVSSTNSNPSKSSLQNIFRENGIGQLLPSNTKMNYTCIYPFWRKNRGPGVGRGRSRGREKS
jgi:hypothetical protein